MYSKLLSNRLALDVLDTENYTRISKDKSCLLVNGVIDPEDGSFSVAPVRVKKHAIHVWMNPELGNSIQIITTDDGFINLTRPTKSKAANAETLDWHYKIFITLVDNPYALN